MSTWHYYKVRMKYYVWKYRGLVTQESNHSISILFNLHCNCILHLIDFLIMDQYSFSHIFYLQQESCQLGSCIVWDIFSLCSPIMFTRQQLFRVLGCLLWWQAFDKELRIKNVLLNSNTHVSEYETAGTSLVPERLPNKYMWGKTMKWQIQKWMKSSWIKSTVLVNDGLFCNLKSFCWVWKFEQAFIFHSNNRKSRLFCSGDLF